MTLSADYYITRVSFLIYCVDSWQTSVDTSLNDKDGINNLLSPEEKQPTWVHKEHRMLVGI
jgi:hypothetical protein